MKSAPRTNMPLLNLTGAVVRLRAESGVVTLVEPAEVVSPTLQPTYAYNGVPVYKAPAYFAVPCTDLLQYDGLIVPPDMALALAAANVPNMCAIFAPGPNESLVLYEPSHDGAKCADAMCVRCGARDCPRGDPLHYHPNGCPSEL